MPSPASIARRAAKQERLDQANALLRVIGSHGRRFFYNAPHDRYAVLFLDPVTSRVWFRDDYSHKRVFLYPSSFGNRRRGFSHGGTLWSLIESLRDYVTHGTLLHYGEIARPMGNGDLWGYGEEATAAVQAAAFALPMFPARSVAQAA
jgi:hypothetical protein